MDRKISRIEIDLETDDCTFYFDGSSEPFSNREFKHDSLSRRHFDSIVYEIQDYNSEVELNERNSDT